MTFITHEVCRIIMFVALCLLLIGFVTLLRLLDYDVCPIMMFVAYWGCHIITFVAL